MSIAYDEYLMEHRDNVYEGYLWFKENLPEYVDPYPNLYHMVCNHDASKDGEWIEYEGYDKYFYGDNPESEEIQKKYLDAWLSHVHNNPHHWEYWIMYDPYYPNDLHVYEMQQEYILEMILDWWSFSKKKRNNYEIFEYYEEFKTKMLFGSETRKKVEEILDAMKNKLDELKEREDESL